MSPFYRLSIPAHRIIETRYTNIVSVFRSSCYLLLATCYLLLATCYLLLATCYLLLIITLLYYLFNYQRLTFIYFYPNKKTEILMNRFLFFSLVNLFTSYQKLTHHLSHQLKPLSLVRLYQIQVLSQVVFQDVSS